MARFGRPGRGAQPHHGAPRPTPAFKADTPYAIALVDLDEGFRLMVNVRGGAGAPLAIGARVRIVFEARGDGAVPIAEMETP